MEVENKLLGERYFIKEQLGAGGSASVYLCYDSKLQKKWAVKELPESADIGRSMELELLKTISCNTFPRIVDIVKENGRVFLIMDYVEGMTLKEKMKRQIITEADVLPWAMEIAKGIRYLHQMTPPILYMDCKPDNIMLTDEGEIRLIDLGSAYVCRTDKKQRISGTRFFAPREQRERTSDHDLPDVRTDIYAFGMTLYYLLTGGKKEWRRNGKLCIKDVIPSVSWGMSHIIEKCTMENPQMRYQSMDEVMNQLRHIREIGKWKAGKAQSVRIIAWSVKAACAFGVLLLAYGFQQSGDKRCLFMMILFAVILLISCFRKKLVTYEINRDIFCGSGKRLLFVWFLVFGLISVLHVTSYAARNDELSDTSIKTGKMIGTAAEDSKIHEEELELDVTIYDSQGRKILIRDGASWGIFEDIVFSIPIEEISKSKGIITISYMSEKNNDVKQYSFECYKK